MSNAILGLTAETATLRAPRAWDSAPMRVAGVDARAEGSRREIVLDRQRVTIGRTVCDIAMRVALPASAYAGIAMCFLPGPDGRGLYRLVLVHRDAELSVPLAEATDETDIFADWALWSKWFGLPQLVERVPGEFAPAQPLMGDVLLLTGSPRRRGRLLTARRGRFALRRRNGAHGERPVHRGEREIIARN